jgi:hypothetical protein
VRSQKRSAHRSTNGRTDRDVADNFQVRSHHSHHEQELRDRRDLASPYSSHAISRKYVMALTESSIDPYWPQAAENGVGCNVGYWGGKRTPFCSPWVLSVVTLSRHSQTGALLDFSLSAPVSWLVSDTLEPSLGTTGAFCRKFRSPIPHGTFRGNWRLYSRALVHPYAVGQFLDFGGPRYERRRRYRQ